MFSWDWCIPQTLPTYIQRSCTSAFCFWWAVLLAENAENRSFLGKRLHTWKWRLVSFFLQLGNFHVSCSFHIPVGIFQRFRYRGLPSGRTLTLLAAAYECDTVVKAGTYDEPQVMDGAVDSGNNAWVPWTRLGRKGWPHVWRVFSSVFSFVLCASGWFHANAEAAKISRFESIPWGPYSRWVL